MNRSRVPIWKLHTGEACGLSVVLAFESKAKDSSLFKNVPKVVPTQQMCEIKSRNVVFKDTFVLLH